MVNIRCARHVVRAIAGNEFAWLVLFLVLLLAIRLAIAALFPLHVDEPYYLIWSMHPAWGYFDHPPLISPWVAAGSQLFGSGALGLRFTSAVAGVVTSLIAYALAREFGVEKRRAFLGAVWVQCVWLTAQGLFGGGVATPDAPAALLWMLACLSAARAARLGSTGWWIAAGAVAGAACLAKYTSFFLAPGLLFWLLTSPGGRRGLAGSGPWLGAVTALAVFAPNLFWNAANEWVTFGKQFGRTAFEWFRPFAPVGLLGSWIGVLGPGLLVAAIFGAVCVGRAVREAAPWHSASFRCMHFLVTVTAPLVLYFLFHSLHSEVLVVWLTPISPLVALLAALAVDGMAPAWRDRFQLVVPVSAICALLLIGEGVFFNRWYTVDILALRSFWGEVMEFLSGAGLTLLIVGVALSPDRPRAPRKMLVAAALALCAASSTIFWTRVYAHPPERVWLDLARKARDSALRHEAEWIGSVTYQTLAQLRVSMPDASNIVQINERVRYPWDLAVDGIDPAAPGLVVVGLDDPWSPTHDRNGIDVPELLERCFASTSRVGSIFRSDYLIGDRREYALHLVARPKKNWLREEC